MTYEELGVHWVKMDGPPVQRGLCPQCSRTQKTPTNCLTVWPKDGTLSCNVCGFGKGVCIFKQQSRFKPAEVKERRTDPTQQMYSYFQKRGISIATVQRNGINMAEHWVPQLQSKQPCICFNYFVGEALINTKYRGPKKSHTQIQGADKTLYKVNDIANETTCIITEGEIDALSFEEAGFKNAVSVPDGAPNPDAKNVENKFAWLNENRHLLHHIETFFLATDSDAPGLRLREELARRLGKTKCRVVEFPSGCKDANDVLCTHGANALAQLIQDAKPYPIEGAMLASERFDYFDDLWANGMPDPARTGWERFDSLFYMRRGYMTVVTGSPSSGKSTFLDGLAVNTCLLHGWKWAIFSPENYPIEAHMERIAEILIGQPLQPQYANQMSREQAQMAKDFINEHFFYIYPQDERFKLETILDIAEYYVRAYGVEGLIIDPYNTIEHHRPSTQNEQEYQAQVLNRIKFFGRNMNLATFLVAHPTKLQKIGSRNAEVVNYEVPNLYSISGSAHWYNIADNGLTVYRYNHSSTFSETHLYVQKVKNKFNGNMGVVPFTFDKACQRFAEMATGTAHTPSQMQTEYDHVEWAED